MKTSIPPLSRFERSPATQALVDRLLESQPDDVISYRELSAIARDDVQNGARHLLQSARRILLREHDVATDAVVDVGIKRLTDAGAVDITVATTRHIKRTASKGQRVLGTVDRGKLDTARLRQMEMNQLQLAMCRVFTSRRAEKQLAAVAEKAALPSTKDLARRTLALFSGSLPN